MYCLILHVQWSVTTSTANIIGAHHICKNIFCSYIFCRLYTCSVNIVHYRLCRVKTTSGRNLLRECGTYAISTLNESIIIITSFISVWRLLISIPWVTWDCTVCDRNKKDFRCCGWPKVGRQPSSFYHLTLSLLWLVSVMDWMQMSHLLSPKLSSLFPLNCLLLPR